MKKSLTTNWDDIPVLMNLTFASVLLDCSTDKLKKLCQKKQIPSFKIGNEWRIEKSQLMAYCGVSKEINNSN